MIALAALGTCIVHLYYYTSPKIERNLFYPKFPMPDSVPTTQRFTDRAGYYAQTRPRYPAQLADFFRSQIALAGGGAVADIGSGTGLLTEVLLEVGDPVFAIEPNADMRKTAEGLLGKHPAFRSVNATAEDTGLGAGAINVVTAGQAFHWFDPVKTRIEFKRILTPRGRVVLVWNERRTAGRPAAEAYAAIVDEFRTAPRSPTHTALTSGNREILRQFFGSEGFEITQFDNHQTLDFDGLVGRVLSSSSMPLPGQGRHEEMMGRLRQFFDEYQVGGSVRIEYDTRLYHGRLS
jgi:SAM-dependent methyltransferase